MLMKLLKWSLRSLAIICFVSVFAVLWECMEYPSTFSLLFGGVAQVVLCFTGLLMAVASFVPQIRQWKAGKMPPPKPVAIKPQGVMCVNCGACPASRYCAEHVSHLCHHCALGHECAQGCTTRPIQLFTQPAKVAP